MIVNAFTVVMLLPPVLAGCAFGLQPGIADPGHARVLRAGSFNVSVHAGAAGATEVPPSEGIALATAGGARIEVQATDTIAWGVDGLAATSVRPGLQLGGEGVSSEGAFTAAAAKGFLTWNPAPPVALRAGVGGGVVTFSPETGPWVVGDFAVAYAPLTMALFEPYVFADLALSGPYQPLVALAVGVGIDATIVEWCSLGAGVYLEAATVPGAAAVSGGGRISAIFKAPLTIFR
ncbi:MAG: hypothetical protein Q8O67_05630 [Deltaproteobacteria bacterium]|nr:hypothetical protein [Deltaproteobacteria bacterium]